MSQPHAEVPTGTPAGEGAPGDLARTSDREATPLAGRGVVEVQVNRQLPVSVPQRSLVQNPSGLLAMAKGVDWRARAPQWTAAVLAGVVAAEVLQTAWILRGIATEPAPAQSGPLLPAPRSFHWWRIASAHLFGAAPHRAVEQEVAHHAAKSITWALSGVMAMSDPKDGIAILGERGKPLNVYHTGAALKEVAGGRLYEVFADHVVLDLPGGMKTLTLPKDRREVGPPQLASLPMAAPEDNSEADLEIGGPRIPPTPAEQVIASLSPQPKYLNGVRIGMRLFPNGHMRRLYGLRRGDVLTEVNGADVTDPEAFESALRAATGSLTLTYLRDGVEQTVSVPLDFGY